MIRTSLDLLPLTKQNTITWLMLQATPTRSRNGNDRCRTSELDSAHTGYVSGYFSATKLQKIGVHVPLVQVKISVKDYLLGSLWSLGCKPWNCSDNDRRKARILKFEGNGRHWVTRINQGWWRQHSTSYSITWSVSNPVSLVYLWLNKQ